MLVSYHWEKMKVNVECDNQKSVSPHTKTVVRDVDYEYEAYVKEEDIVDYLNPYSPKEKELRNFAKSMLEKMYEFLSGVSAIDIDQLENDKYFVEFIKERYEEEALKEWEEYNDAY